MKGRRLAFFAKWVARSGATRSQRARVFRPFDGIAAPDEMGSALSKTCAPSCSMQETDIHIYIYISVQASRRGDFVLGP